MTGLLLTAGALIIAVMGAFFKGSLSGAAKERAKQDAERTKARDIADQVQNDVGALPANQAKSEMKTWSPED